ncbi:unnamed protein product [Sympodiomycopsis kandeliae]
MASSSSVADRLSKLGMVKVGGVRQVKRKGPNVKKEANIAESPLKIDSENAKRKGDQLYRREAPIPTDVADFISDSQPLPLRVVGIVSFLEHPLPSPDEDFAVIRAAALSKGISVESLMQYNAEALRSLFNDILYLKLLLETTDQCHTDYLYLCFNARLKSLFARSFRHEHDKGKFNMLQFLYTPPVRTETSKAVQARLYWERHAFFCTDTQYKAKLHLDRTAKAAEDLHNVARRLHDGIVQWEAHLEVATQIVQAHAEVSLKDRGHIRRVFAAHEKNKAPQPSCNSFQSDWPCLCHHPDPVCHFLAVEPLTETERSSTGYSHFLEPLVKYLFRSPRHFTDCSIEERKCVVLRYGLYKKAGERDPRAVPREGMDLNNHPAFLPKDSSTVGISISAGDDGTSPLDVGRDGYFWGPPPMNMFDMEHFSYDIGLRARQHFCYVLFAGIAWIEHFITQSPDEGPPLCDAPPHHQNKGGASYNLPWPSYIDYNWIKGLQKLTQQMSMAGQAVIAAAMMGIYDERLISCALKEDGSKDKFFVPIFKVFTTLLSGYKFLRCVGEVPVSPLPWQHMVTLLGKHIRITNMIPYRHVFLDPEEPHTPSLCHWSLFTIELEERKIPSGVQETS